MFKSPSVCLIAHLKLVLLTLVISVSVLGPAHSARSSSSSSSAESTGGGDSNQQTSLVPSSTLHYRDRGNRELISAQFRAAQDARDLDTSESSISGLETLSAAAAAHHGGLDDDGLSLAKYMAASASTYSPSKMRMNRFNQAGFYDPYPSYASVFPSSVPSSYYPYNAYSYRDSNPMLDTYPYYERDRVRELRERAMQASQSAPYASSSSSSSVGSSSNRDGYGAGGGGWGYREGYRSNDHDNTAMSSGHGHDDHHGGGGWGWGKEYTSKVNTNAIGLLGLLGLLSLLSNVLLQFTTTTTTTTTAAGGRRKKRDTGEIEESHEEKRERIFKEILPHLTPIAHAKDGLIPLECTLNGICMANKVLVDELGFHGRTAGQRISNAVVKLLEKVERTPASIRLNSKKHPGGKWNLKKKLESAGLHGRNKKNCEKSYPVCSTLQKQAGPSLPFIIRMQDLPELISKITNLTKLGRGPVPMDL